MDMPGARGHDLHEPVWSQSRSLEHVAPHAAPCTHDPPAQWEHLVGWHPALVAHAAPHAPGTHLPPVQEEQSAPQSLAEEHAPPHCDVHFPARHVVQLPPYVLQSPSAVHVAPQPNPTHRPSVGLQVGQSPPQSEADLHWATQNVDVQHRPDPHVPVGRHSGHWREQTLVAFGLIDDTSHAALHPARHTFASHAWQAPMHLMAELQ